MNKININAKIVRIQPDNKVSLGDPEPALRVEFYSCVPCTTPGPSVTGPSTPGSSTPSTIYCNAFLKAEKRNIYSIIHERYNISYNIFSSSTKSRNKLLSARFLPLL